MDALMRRVGERPVMLAGAVILGGGVALAATADSPLGLLLWFGGVAGMGAGLLGSVAQLVILSRWFRTARGAVNGVAFSGMGFGIFLFAPLAALLIDRVGWRRAMAGLGMGAGLLLLPAVVLSPRKLAEPVHSPVQGLERSDEGPGLAAAVATPRFWFFAAAFFFTPVSNFMVTTHQVAHIVEAGIDPRRGGGRVRSGWSPVSLRARHVRDALRQVGPGPDGAELRGNGGRDAPSSFSRPERPDGSCGPTCCRSA